MGGVHMVEQMTSLDEIAERIIKANAVEVRDVDGGAEPFVYSSANRGPGYIMIKGLPGQPETLMFLTKRLAYKVVDQASFDFFEGNATGGMIPGWQLRSDVSELIGRQIPFCYLRGSRKQGGHDELITGDRNNPLIKKGMRALVIEELVNFAQTTTNAAVAFREAGYLVSHAACILHYDNPEANRTLKEADVTLVPLITLPQLLDVAEAQSLIPPAAMASYRSFLADPVDWQLQRGYVIPEASARKAEERGQKMRRLLPDEAIRLGAPEAKVKSDFVYFAKED
jgi:orotate phosphoribosyltransferase